MPRLPRHALGDGFNHDLDQAEIGMGNFLESGAAEINHAALLEEAPGGSAIRDGDQHAA